MYHVYADIHMRMVSGNVRFSVRTHLSVLYFASAYMGFCQDMHTCGIVPLQPACSSSSATGLPD